MILRSEPETYRPAPRRRAHREPSVRVRKNPMMGRHTCIAALCAGLLLAGCATPIGIKRVDPQRIQLELAESVLTSKNFSAETQNAIRFANLEEDVNKRPVEAIAFIHGVLLKNANLGESASRRALIALSEISFKYANDSGNRHYYFASALYAWLFLFPEDKALQPDGFDPRLRLAADLYNRSVTLAFVDKDSDTVQMKTEMIDLPVGKLEIVLDESSLVWGDRRLIDFVPVSEVEVRGLRNRYRRRGIGAPFAAVLEPVEPDDRRDAYLTPALRLPVAAVLRFENLGALLDGGIARARLEMHAAPDGDTIEIDGRDVPLEMEPTSSIASMLTEQNPLWRDLKAFFAGDLARNRDGLVSLEPYKTGRIPVVLVHGTFSSGTTWAEVINDLSSDVEIRKRFQFWIFDYNTGNPIAYSAMLLRRAIDDLMQSLDPEGKDPALKRMIVVGHSQGGLLTKMTAVDSGLDLWSLLSDKPPEEVELSDESRSILEGSLLVDPIPQVERVVFIATPHRGSYLANWNIAKWVGRFARSPVAVIDAALDLVTNDEEDLSKRQIARVSGSIDNMAPGNKFLERLVSIPVVPEVTTHSIIPVQDEPDLEDPEEREDASDGVVKFLSARIDGVTSQLVVPSAHTCLQHPWTIAELRRILLSHVGLTRVDPADMNLP